MTAGGPLTTVSESCFIFKQPWLVASLVKIIRMKIFKWLILRSSRRQTSRVVCSRCRCELLCEICQMLSTGRCGLLVVTAVNVISMDSRHWSCHHSSMIYICHNTGEFSIFLSPPYDTSVDGKTKGELHIISFFGPFHGAIEIASVMRCRCRRGHRCAGGARQYR